MQVHTQLEDNDPAARAGSTYALHFVHSYVHSYVYYVRIVAMYVHVLRYYVRC